MSTARPITLLVALGALAAACSGKVASEPGDAGAEPGPAPGSTTPTGPSRPPVPTGSDAASPPPGSGNACAERGGLCLPPYSTPPGPPARKPSKEALCPGDESCWLVVAYPEGAACKTDVDCNESPATSSVQHKCFEGICICQAPFHVQPSGKCGKNEPPDCAAHSGTCRQNPAECQPGEHGASLSTDMSCGDFVAAVCCIPICKTPVDLVCCGASTTPYEPLCVNGWRTCEGLQPALRSKGCF